MEKERKAVIMYSLTRYNQKGHMKVIREEALEDGIAIGEERGREKQLTLIIENMLSLGKSPEEIAEWPSFQSGRIGKRGDVFADHIRLIPILLELKPFFLCWV